MVLAKLIKFIARHMYLMGLIVIDASLKISWGVTTAVAYYILIEGTFYNAPVLIIWWTIAIIGTVSWMIIFWGYMVNWRNNKES